MKERKKWVDVLRALAMLFVVYGHRVSGWNEYFVFTSPIKIPLFFAITGYVFNDANGDTKKFLKKLLRTIIIPWIVIAGLPYLVAAPIKGFSFLTTKLIALVTGENYWYMPCCIVAEIMWFLVRKYMKPAWISGVVSALLFVIGVILYKYGILSVFMINRAFSVQIYLYIGWLIKEYEETIIGRVNNTVTLMACIFIYILLGVGSLVLYPGRNLDVHLCSYYNVFICIMMIWIGIITLVALVKNRVKKYPRLLVMIGQNTLVIYLLHSYFVRGFVKVFSIAHIPLNRVTNIILTIIVCLMGMMVSEAINRLFPELVGKKRIK